MPLTPCQHIFSRSSGGGVSTPPRAGQAPRLPCCGPRQWSAALGQEAGVDVARETDRRRACGPVPRHDSGADQGSARRLHRSHADGEARAEAAQGVLVHREEVGVGKQDRLAAVGLPDPLEVGGLLAAFFGCHAAMSTTDGASAARARGGFKLVTWKLDEMRSPVGLAGCTAMPASSS